MSDRKVYAKCGGVFTTLYDAFKALYPLPPNPFRDGPKEDLTKFVEIRDTLGSLSQHGAARLFDRSAAMTFQDAALLLPSCLQLCFSACKCFGELFCLQRELLLISL